MTKAIISITSTSTLFSEMREIAKKLDRGEILPEADYHLSFSDSAQLFRELTPTRLALLEHLKKDGPQSTSQATRQKLQ